MKIFFVHGPESEGRPEGFIAQLVFTALISKLYDYDNIELVEIDPNDETSKDPLGASAFYDDDTFMNCFLKSSHRLYQEVQSGDTVFFMEGLNPTIALLRYYWFCSGKNVKTVGLYHSNTATPGDLFFGNPMMVSMEKWLNTHGFTKIIVATEYLKKNVTYLCRDTTKIAVTGLPIYDQAFTAPSERENTVIFSHRWAEDKRKDKFLKMGAINAGMGKPITYKVLSPVQLPYEDIAEMEANGIDFVHCAAKYTYWQELRRAKVIFSWAILETFGYSVMEAIAEGCVPYVVDDTSYRELIQPEFRFPVDTAEEVVCSQLVRLCSSWQEGHSKSSLTPFACSCVKAHHRIAETILEVANG